MVNEKRLMYVDDFKKNMCSYCNTYLSEEPCEPNECWVCDVIAQTDTVDAVEVPPVKIGDKAFFIVNGKIYEAEICLISWCQFRRTGKTTELRGEVTKNHTVSARFSDWGKTVFTTKEEAEKVLYPCEYCFCGTYRSCDGCSYGERKEDGLQTV